MAISFSWKQIRRRRAGAPAPRFPIFGKVCLAWIAHSWPRRHLDLKHDIARGAPTLSGVTVGGASLRVSRLTCPWQPTRRCTTRPSYSIKAAMATELSRWEDGLISSDVLRCSREVRERSMSRSCAMQGPVQGSMQGAMRGAMPYQEWETPRDANTIDRYTNGTTFTSLSIGLENLPFYRPGEPHFPGLKTGLEKWIQSWGTRVGSSELGGLGPSRKRVQTFKRAHKRAKKSKMLKNGTKSVKRANFNIPGPPGLSLAMKFVRPRGLVSPVSPALNGVRPPGGSRGNTDKSNRSCNSFLTDPSL